MGQHLECLEASNQNKKQRNNDVSIENSETLPSLHSTFVQFHENNDIQSTCHVTSNKRKQCSINGIQGDSRAINIDDLYSMPNPHESSLLGSAPKTIGDDTETESTTKPKPTMKTLRTNDGEQCFDKMTFVGLRFLLPIQLNKHTILLELSSVLT